MSTLYIHLPKFPLHSLLKFTYTKKLFPHTLCTVLLICSLNFPRAGRFRCNSDDDLTETRQSHTLSHFFLINAFSFIPCRTHSLIPFWINPFLCIFFHSFMQFRINPSSFMPCLSRLNSSILTYLLFQSSLIPVCVDPLSFILASLIPFV